MIRAGVINHREHARTTAPSAARQAIGGRREVYLHFHGATAEDVAAILERSRQDR